MIQTYSKEAWNLHVPELLDLFQPCVFNGEVLEQDCKGPGPTPGELLWLRKILLSLPNVSKVLDFGCGIGLFVGLFEGFDYTGADRTERMIFTARQKNPKHAFVHLEMQSLPDEAFDLVFTRAVMQHNLEPVKSELIQEFGRVLQPGGYYLFHEHSFLSVGNSGEEQVPLIPTYMTERGFKLVDSLPPFMWLFQKN